MKEKAQEPIIGIGTPLMIDGGEYVVFSITGKRETDSIGNVTVKPLVLARKHNRVGSSSVVAFTGAELEGVV